jgi:glycosyltransferase involved in cell wall biosynthesis
MPCRLSIVLPAYNEEGNIERAVRDAAAAGALLGVSYQVVAVDDGSRDGTRAILERLSQEMGDALRLERFEENQGYGAALRAGFRAAEGEILFFTDSDNQFDLTELVGVLPLIEDHDAVFGYRIDRRDPALRRFTSRTFNGLVSLVFGLSVRDLNCSFKLFRRQRLDTLELVSNDFFIDTELVARIHLAKWRYTQVGVHHFPRAAGISTVRTSDVPRTLLSLARMWLRLRAPVRA